MAAEDHPAADNGELDGLQALLAALLRSMEALGFIARHLNPADIPAVMRAVGAPDADLRAAGAELETWSANLAEIGRHIGVARDATLAAFDGVRAAPDLRGLYRALRSLPRAQEALYPLASVLPPVSRFFLEPGARGDEALMARIAVAGTGADTGVMHAGPEPGARGGFSVYVPEYYQPDRAWPLVVALHGGSGNGRAFLWSWLASARSRGAILAAPTATGDTWALTGDDLDTPNLGRLVETVGARWRLDPERLLLTGMSDGGTFSYVTGLEADSPFTHLAPVAAAFHPFLAQMADGDRIRGLPIFQVHGALDWMFPVESAREARDALLLAGAAVTYREIADLSHCYPREINWEILDWMGVGSRSERASGIGTAG